MYQIKVDDEEPIHMTTPWASFESWIKEREAQGCKVVVHQIISTKVYATSSISLSPPEKRA